jgi:hypothetical protein
MKREGERIIKQPDINNILLIFCTKQINFYILKATKTNNENSWSKIINVILIAIIIIINFDGLSGITPDRKIIILLLLNIDIETIFSIYFYLIH